MVVLENLGDIIFVKTDKKGKDKVVNIYEKINISIFIVN